ncbi:MAG TPA: glycosyltransferase family 4 protein, partial [Acidimicrobiales bacterium]|nr:glycosyltransferase family 4 protein [Acidimicrobiales bacterium]
EARVFVCTAGAGSSNLRLLEAMACGAPVVAASQPGNAELLANVHNALVGPAGDAPALAALARQVLDDATLAAELAEAGLETARHTACPAAVRDVRAVLEKVLLVKDEEMSLELQGMGAAASGASGDEPDVDLRDIVLGGEDAAAQLLARARSCPTRELAIPVSRPVIGAFRRVTWEVVARQPLGDPGVTRAYLPGRGEQRPDAGELEDGLAALRRGDHQGALATLLPELQQGDKERQASLLRWVVVALLGLRRWQDALGLASAGFEAYPTHPDFLALSFIAATAASAPMDLEVTMRSVKLLGNGSRFDEWLDDPLGLMRQHLVGGLGLQP